MADLKISALTSASTPLAGTEVLPLVQSSTTKKVAVSDLTAGRAVSGLSFTATKVGNDAFIKVENSGSGAAGAWLFVDSNDLNYLGTVLQSAGVEKWFAGSYGTSAYQIKNGGRGGTEALRVETSNDVKVSVGNLVQGTAAKGINFTANTPAAGMTSQLLNWYEQGTFTPTLSGSGGDPTSTYTTQVGYYTRVGNLVTIYIQVFTSSYTGGSGTLQIKALPFAATNGARFNINTVRITFGVAATQICAAVDGASTTIYFDESNSGLSDTTLALSAWNSGASAGMTIFGSYTI